MTETDKAYLAGFIDGEGSIGLRTTHTNRKPKYRSLCLRLRITQCDRPILEWIKAVTGVGSVRQGSVQTDRHQERFGWSCAGQYALRVLHEVYPYLKLKRIQSEIAFEFEKTMLGSGKPLPEELHIKRQTLREAMDELHSHKHGGI